MTAAGGASVVASLIFGSFVLQKKATVGDHCHDKVCDPTGLAAGSAGSTFSVLATATFIGGALAVGTGTYLFLSAPQADATRGHGRSLQPTLTLTGTF